MQHQGTGEAHYCSYKLLHLLNLLGLTTCKGSGYCGYECSHAQE